MFLLVNYRFQETTEADDDSLDVTWESSESWTVVPDCWHKKSGSFSTALLNNLGIFRVKSKQICSCHICNTWQAWMLLFSPWFSLSLRHLFTFYPKKGPDYYYYCIWTCHFSYFMYRCPWHWRIAFRWGESSSDHEWKIVNFQSPRSQNSSKVHRWNQCCT